MAEEKEGRRAATAANAPRKVARPAKVRGLESRRNTQTEILFNAESPGRLWAEKDDKNPPLPGGFLSSFSRAAVFHSIASARRCQCYSGGIVKRAPLFVLCCLALLVLFGAPKRASAYLVFDQSPPNEMQSGAILDTANFVSFGCTLGLNCGAAVGETVYRVGVWLKKVGDPKDIRLAVVDDWHDVATSTDVFSLSLSADTISDTGYHLTWFDFPEGVVIGKQDAFDQLFQFQFTDANGTYSATDHYRMLRYDYSTYLAHAQWCKTGWGCFWSPIYFRLDAGPVPSAPDHFYATSTRPGNELYATDFSADPKWTTDEPGHFSWDASLQEMHAHIENTPSPYQPNRYFIKELNIDPAQSFSISADLLMDSVKDAGVMLFGLYADDLAHQHVTYSYSPLIYSKSTLNMKLMKLESALGGHGLNIIGKDDIYSWGQGGVGGVFRMYRWYTVYLHYDAPRRRVYGEVIDTKTGVPYLSLVRDLPTGFKGFSPDMRYLGVSMHPDGEPGSTMAQAAWRLAGSSDFRIDNVRVTGTPATTPPVLDGFSNIFFIPGVEASRLYEQGTFSENRLWEPNRTADVEKLYLDENGNSIKAGIYTRDVIDEAFGFNIYLKFMESLDKLVTDGTIAEWKSFPYDWRKNQDDVARFGTSIKTGDEFSVVNMADELIDLASTSKSGKVTIIGHSNGGLVGKLLIDELARRDRADLIDKFIMVATPQLGTPKALASLLHGDGQAIPWEHFGIVMDAEMARQFAENMPGGYSLLPSGKYFSEVSDVPIEFSEDVSEIYDFRSLYGDSVDSKSELDQFLLGDSGARTKPDVSDTDSPNVLNNALLQESSNTQNHLDSWTAPEGIKVIQIVGWGRDTVRGIRYDDCDIFLCPDTLSNLDRELLLFEDGDDTVVASSAAAMKGAETYYVDLPAHNFLLKRNRKHADILEAEPVQKLIESLVRNGTTTLPTHISVDKPTSDEDKRLRFRIHSPVSLDLYDADGNHTGLVATTSDSYFRRFEAEIPNSYYQEFGEVKYAGAGDTPVDVVLVGQDTGTFTLEIEELQGNTVDETSVFTDIPVVEGSRAIVEEAGSPATPSLLLDIDSDGINDAAVASGAGLSSQELVGILRGILKTLDLPMEKAKYLDKILDKIDKTLIKDQKCGANAKAKCEHNIKHKTDQTFTKLSQAIQKLSQDKRGFLTKEEATEILGVIEKIRNAIIQQP